ncbi:unnamed protein product, partial [Meganyctiphanes norvegica]
CTNMAGRAHVDDSVIERRLRPIYEWLDTGNNKKAVQEADKVLRKQSNLHCARVLKGLAQLRLGKKEECQSAISAVIKEGPTDEATLQALTICFRELHQPEEICKVYEAAVKTEPKNEELLSHLFMSYVRIGDYKQQQKTAMHLYKLKPKNPYYFWAVMSHVMQAHRSGDALVQKVSLPLAERMVHKFVTEGKIEAEAEVLTYLHILEIQGKWSEALEVLDSPLAGKIVQQPQNFLQLKRASYLANLKSWTDASQVYRTLIAQEPDNWQHYEEYIRCSLEMWANNETEDTNSHDNHLEEVSRFLHEMQRATIDEASKHRAPRLGLLHLALMLHKQGLDDDIPRLAGDIIELLYQHVKSYGDKMCCYGDIVNFLPLLEEDQINTFLERIYVLVELDSEGVPENVLSIYRHHCWLQLKESLGKQNLLCSKHLELADSLVNLYHQTKHFSSDMAATDIRPNDTYLIIAAHNYLAAIKKSLLKKENTNGEFENDIDVYPLIPKFCAILEHGIEVSKANFQLKLLLIKFYNMQGALSASHIVYENLELKHIQLDTLGHVLALQMTDGAHFTAAEEIFNTTLKFFMANNKDTSDPLISSYKYGSLTRIPEFVDFRERLNNSLHFATVRAELMILELTSKVSSPLAILATFSGMGENELKIEKSKTTRDSMTDDRPARMLLLWASHRLRLQEEAIEKSREADIAMLWLRKLILELLAVATSLSTFPEQEKIARDNKENSCVNGCVSKSSSAELIDVTSLLQKRYQESLLLPSLNSAQFPIQAADISRIYLYSSSGYVPAIVKHAELLQVIHKCTQDSISQDSWSEESLKSSRDSVEQLLTEQQLVLSQIQSRPGTILPHSNTQALAHLTHCLQTVGIIVILLGSCSDILKPVKAQVIKKSKKRRDPVVLPEMIGHFNSYLCLMINRLEEVSSAVEELHLSIEVSMKSNISSSYNYINIDEVPHNSSMDLESVCQRIESSLLSSLQQISAAMKSKVKYIRTLQL